jgi:hypothetical protein
MRKKKPLNRQKLTFFLSKRRKKWSLFENLLIWISLNRFLKLSRRQKSGGVRLTAKAARFFNRQKSRKTFKLKLL